MQDLITISKIELKGKKRKSYLLYQDDVFLQEITEDTLVKFSISKGSSFSRTEFKEVLHYNNINKCLHQAYTYLRYRPHLRRDLKTKLLQKKYEPFIIEETLKALEDKQYLNDRDYIALFIRDAIKQRKSGPFLIRKKLLEKGANLSEVDNQLKILYPDNLQIEIASRLLEKKNSKINESDIRKRKQKLSQFGQSRGFAWPAIEYFVVKLDN